jgi:hypothetical protein
VRSLAVLSCLFVQLTARATYKDNGDSSPNLRLGEQRLLGIEMQIKPSPELVAWGPLPDDAKV